MWYQTQHVHVDVDVDAWRHSQQTFNNCTIDEYLGLGAIRGYTRDRGEGLWLHLAYSAPQHEQAASLDKHAASVW